MQDNPFEYAIDNSSVVRNDASLMNVLTEMGTAGDTSLYTTPSTGKRFSPTQLELLHEAPLLNAFCSAIPDSAISKPFEFSFGGMDKQVDVKKVSEIADWLSEFGVPEKTAKAQTFANVYGGAAIVYFVDDGQAQDQPLDLSKLKKFVATRVLDCQKVTPFLDTVTTLDDITYYDVSTHGLNFDTPNDANKGYIRFHKSRIIPFYGVLLTDNAMLQRYQAWGKSTIEAIWESYRDYRTGILASSGNLGDSSLAIISMEGFIELLRANDTETIKNVFNSVRQMASNQKMMLIDKDKQDIRYVERQFTGVSQVIDKLREDFIGQTRIPHDKLFGESPSGLGATGEAEEKNWAKEVRQFQERRWRKALKKQYEILLSLPDSPLKGKLPKQWTFTFPSILELTQEEEINNKTAQSNIDSTYNSIGVLTVDEIRESRFGGTTFSYDTTLDQKAYEAEKKKQEQQAFGGFGGFGGFGQEEEAPVTQEDSLRYDAKGSRLQTYYHGSPTSSIEELRSGSYITPDLDTAYQMGRYYTSTGKTWSDEDLATPHRFGEEPVFKNGREPDGKPTIYTFKAKTQDLDLLDNPYEHVTKKAYKVKKLEVKKGKPCGESYISKSRKCNKGNRRLDTMRPSCMDCVTKHLGSALVLGHEVENGYPHHIIEMVGQLHEAEKEVEDFSKEAAGAIRDLRRTCWSEHRSPMQEEVMQIYALLGYEWAQGFATQEEEIELPSYRVLGEDGYKNDSKNRKGLKKIVKTTKEGHKQAYWIKPNSAQLSQSNLSQGVQLEPDFIRIKKEGVDQRLQGKIISGATPVIEEKANFIRRENKKISEGEAVALAEFISDDFKDITESLYAPQRQSQAKKAINQAKAVLAANAMEKLPSATPEHISEEMNKDGKNNELEKLVWKHSLESDPDRVLLRYVNLDKKQIQKYEQNLGKTITEEAFMSTTTEVRETEFSEKAKVAYEIEPKSRNTKGRYVDRYKNQVTEAEVAYPPYSQFEVVEVRRKDTVHPAKVESRYLLPGELVRKNHENQLKPDLHEKELSLIDEELGKHKATLEEYRKAEKSDDRRKMAKLEKELEDIHWNIKDYSWEIASRMSQNGVPADYDNEDTNFYVAAGDRNVVVERLDRKTLATLLKEVQQAKSEFYPDSQIPVNKKKFDYVIRLREV